MAGRNLPTKMIPQIFFILATLSYSTSVYIPPGPAYPCPKETDKLLLHPCVCENGTDAGLFVKCENVGLAALSVGVGNIAGLGLPIERLLLKECSFTHLYGPLFHRSTIRVLHIEDTPIKTIDGFAFAGVNKTLQELYFKNTDFEIFPKEAFKILSNLSRLSIDGHKMATLSKDIFAGSEAAGRLERLHITNGQLREFPVETFQSLRKLKTLDLHGNQLATLKKNQFKGLRETEVLDISHNKISKLDGSHMSDLARMGWCNASHNLIADIPRGMFARNTVIKVVHLNNNKLKKLDTNSFKGMRFMRRLYLQDNQISEVGRGTFASVTRIGTIDLARNRLAKVDYQMFQSARFAEMINLAENNITKIESQAFTDLYLATVNISHNGLTTIEKNAFINCNNMSVLDLTYNNLTSIDKKAFDENTYAFELNVAFNYFTDFGQVPIQNMTGIRIVNASFNRLEVVPRNSFPKLYELHTVDLSHNLITDIYNGVFQNLFSLRYLNLAHNSLAAIKPATFGPLPTLVSLDLSHNKLTSVSRSSLAKLSSVRSIDVTYNMLDSLFLIPPSLASLNLAHNALRSLPDDTWPAMNALLSLNVSSNELTLSRRSLASLLTLQRLDLSNNSLVSPPWEALSGLSSLQYLYMQDNKLTSLKKSSFGTLPVVFELDLSRNNISSLEPLAFSGLQQLQNLSLSDNGLTHIPNEAFKSLVALRRLDLSHNLLEKIDNKTNGLLDDCLSLEMLNLSYNRIAFLTKKMFPWSPWFPYRLFEVDLSHNALPVVTRDITRGLQRVRRLHLSGNTISEFREHVLGNLTSLEVLDVSDNLLTDLLASTHQHKLILPENITELYLQNNQIVNLPVQSLVEAKKLKKLDLRNNYLTMFDNSLVKKIKNEGLEVYFDGNTLKCDCFARPLKHYINHLTPSLLQTDNTYNISCKEPVNLASYSIMTVDEDRLLCNGDNFTKIDEFDFVNEPDVAFRDVQYSQTSIYVYWFVLSTQDVADLLVYIKDDKNQILTSTQVLYNLRSLTLAIDQDLETALKKGGNFDICLQAKTSNNSPRKWYPSQCQKLEGNFDSWPKKLTVDKRRLSRKKVKYSWFSNSVLGLVSDSILITLCIFLGVCLKITDLY